MLFVALAVMALVVSKSVSAVPSCRVVIEQTETYNTANPLINLVEIDFFLGGVEQIVPTAYWSAPCGMQSGYGLGNCNDGNKDYTKVTISGIKYNACKTGATAACPVQSIVINSGLTNFDQIRIQNLPQSDSNSDRIVGASISVIRNADNAVVYRDFFTEDHSVYNFYNINLNAYGSPDPTPAPSAVPTLTPTAPTQAPTISPSVEPSQAPTLAPSDAPTVTPSWNPTVVPTLTPSVKPTLVPTVGPSVKPTQIPTLTPTLKPTVSPTLMPTAPTMSPTTGSPTTPLVYTIEIFNSGYKPNGQYNERNYNAKVTLCEVRLIRNGVYLPAAVMSASFTGGSYIGPAAALVDGRDDTCMSSILPESAYGIPAQTPASLYPTLTVTTSTPFDAVVISNSYTTYINGVTGQPAKLYNIDLGQYAGFFVYAGPVVTSTQPIFSQSFPGGGPATYTFSLSTPLPLSNGPTAVPTTKPTVLPTVRPTVLPSALPSLRPTAVPSVIPTTTSP